MAQFNVTELDFDKIKASIKAHFRSQTKYSDWDFDGAGLSTVVDILAYNTHYNAMVAHFSLNETFLDSAQIRGNVVSHAKLIGYTPKSVNAPTAVLDITVTAPAISPPSTLNIPRGTRFNTQIDNILYPFVTISSAEASLSGGTHYLFDAEHLNQLHIKQGVLKRMIYRVDTSIENQKFIIPEENVDISTLRVRVKPTETSTDYITYSKFYTLTAVTSTSAIYFTQENSSGKFEVYFGDNYIGKKPTSNSIVELEYVYGNGEFANGASVFTAVDRVNSLELNATTATIASGGSARESIESIRYNAPLTFASQNRAVTADDYKAIISKEFSGIDSISVWGGENAVEPDFGKVFISIKKSNTNLLLTAEDKQVILNTILAGKNVVSIRPYIVDPEYTYLELDVFFKYNPNLTDELKFELQRKVRATIQTYADDNLKRFDGVFRYSNLLKNIDQTDRSILNSDLRVYMHKYAIPRASGINYFDLLFSSPIYQTSSSSPVLSSSIFQIAAVDHEIGDIPIVGSVNRTVFLYKYIGGVKTAVRAVGTIYTADGRVVINGVQPDTTARIRITVTPNSHDLAPKRNQLLDIDFNFVSITGEVDSIAVGGSSGGITYTTPSRHRAGS